MARRPPLSAVAILALVGIAADPAPAEEFGSAAHRQRAAIIAALFNAPLGQVSLPGAGCDNAISQAPTIAADAQFHLAALVAGGMVTARCEPAEAGSEACRVSIGQSVPGTENRWSRIYQFRRSTTGAADPASIACLTLP